MENDINESEAAFMAWLNALNLGPSKVKSIQDLYDGILLMTLLNKLDNSRFPTVGFHFYPNDTADYKSNILRLCKFLDSYLKVPADPIDVALIVQNRDKVNLLRLCERVLGAIVNSSNKEEYIDPILGLDEKYQVFLMDMIMKYIPQEKTEECESPPLTERRREYIAFIEHYGKIEKENEELNKKLQDSFIAQDDLTKENKKLQKEAEELRRITESIEPLSARIRQDTAVIQEIDALKAEIRELRQKLKRAEKDKNEETEKFKKEVSKVKEIEKTLRNSEGINQQLKRKIATLTEDSKMLNKVLEQTEQKCIQARETQSRLLGLEDQLEQTMSELFTFKEKCKKLEGEKQKTLELVENLQKELSKSSENERFWRQKAGENTEELVRTKEENASLKVVAGTGNLLSEEQEALYCEQIRTLEEKLESCKKEANERVKNAVFELETKCEETLSENQKLVAEVYVASVKQTELQKENQKVREEIAEIKRSAPDMMKECIRLKKDRDTLLEVSKRAQDSLEELKSLKTENARLLKESMDLSKIIKEMKEEKGKLVKELGKTNEVNNKLNKEVMVLEERNNLLKEEINKANDKLRDYENKIPMEVEKRVKEEVDKQKSIIKEKHRQKREALKKSLTKKEGQLENKENETVLLKRQVHEQVEKIKCQYEKELKDAKIKYENEREQEKVKVLEVEELHKREERLLTSTIYELGAKIAELTMERRKLRTMKSSSRAFQHNLSNLM